MTMAWCFEDQANEHTRSVLENLAKAEAVVPAIWALEVVNALIVAERRKKLTQAAALEFVALLDGLAVSTDLRTGAQAFSSAFPLARQHGLSAYDAAYLELAIREGLPLATRDEKLARAARAAGVDLV